MGDKRGLKHFLRIYATCFAIANVPQFVITYTTPKNELKPTLSEHLNSEMNSLFDMGEGAIYANFRFLGSSTGYVSKRIAGCIEDLF